MGNEITKAGQQITSRTPWQPPQLAPWLVQMLDTESVWRDAKLPVLSERHLAVVITALDGYAAMPIGSSIARIDKLMGTAALAYPSAKMSDAEADARLRLYQSELADIHQETLGAAFSAAVREIKFFPSIAELRALAAKQPTPRRFIIARRLKRLVEAHKPAEVIDYVDPQEVRALVSRMSGALSVCIQ